MKDKNGKIIGKEIQEKRYKQGRKANWRNTNSTDVKIITQEEYNQIGKYINKYITKQETEKNQNAEIKITSGTAVSTICQGILGLHKCGKSSATFKKRRIKYRINVWSKRSRRYGCKWRSSTRKSRTTTR